MKQRGFIGCAVIGVILSLPGTVLAADVSGLLKEAQGHWEKRAELAEAKLAVAVYQQATSTAADHYEANWRLARACWWLGDHSPQNERVAIFQKGKEAAEQAIRMAPDSVEGHFWLGTCLGRMGEEQGVLNSLFLIDPIAKEMEKVLALNPTYGRAAHILGVVYRKAPGWPLSRGDMQKSLAYARQAVAQEPDLVLNHLGLAETLIALNQKDEAKKVLTAALALPGPADEQPETKDDQAKAQKLLEELK